MHLISILRFARSRLVVRHFSRRSHSRTEALSRVLRHSRRLHWRLHRLLLRDLRLPRNVNRRGDENLPARTSWGTRAACSLVRIIGGRLRWRRLHRLPRVVDWRGLVYLVQLVGIQRVGDSLPIKIGIQGHSCFGGRHVVYVSFSRYLHQFLDFLPFLRDLQVDVRKNFFVDAGRLVVAHLNEIFSKEIGKHLSNLY